jgi:ribonucleoside-diphosphate reductase alpha chain
MLSTGEPGFCVDTGDKAGEDLRNACAEVSSRNDSDICNLGSINVARVKDLEHMKRLVEISTAFLVAGSVYSDVPYAAIDQVRTRNRRIGLGLMGLHEWLLKHGKKYGKDAELEEYLKIYATNLKYAKQYAKLWDLTVPVAGRAIAPTGTIGIVAETSTGIEPVFCVAYKRRYLKGDVVHYQYVVDPVAQRLINSGISAEQIEDAYSLSEDVERRVEFQEWVQKYVDHCVSSTINLPQWGSEFNNESLVTSFGKMLIKHLPNLRGITCYPDGARGGQPLTPVAYKTAIKHVGKVFVEQADVCSITNRGSCGA